MELNVSPLLTDLYQLTMMQAYLDHGMEEPAAFEFFVRKLPESRNFLLACGLDSVLQYLETLHFTADDVAWLASTGRFNPRCLDYLAAFRFTGAVDAMPEGTVFFSDEPILRVVAPLPAAQLLETRIINLLHVQTLLASKAARVVLAADGKQLVEFGLRRTHGAEAALLAARACYLAGFDGSSNVLAEQCFGIPAYGTMAHSFIQAHSDESTALADFVQSFPRRTVVLIDTYDTEQGARKVLDLALKLRADGIEIGAVRIDSGDLGAHAQAVRHILDAGGCSDIGIFASGNLDEYQIQALLAAGAPIDGFGVGTRVTTSNDCAYLDCAYKLQEYVGQPRRKRSEGKATWPGRKQVFRYRDTDGMLTRDVLGLDTEELDGEPLLRPVMQDGRRLAPALGMAELRAYTRTQLTTLPAALRNLQPAAPYPVDISAELLNLAEQFDRGAQPP